MKQNRNILFVFILLVLAGALCRIIPGRPLGFAPQLAMAIFGGAVIKEKGWAFGLTIFSMFLSDLLFEVLNRNGLVYNMPGFYEGQWVNYLLLAGITFIGFGIKKPSVVNVGIAALGAPLVYFFLSNSITWAAGGGYARPMNFNGFMMALNDGLPFLKGSVMATVAFSALFFGSYAYFFGSTKAQLTQASA